MPLKKRYPQDEHCANFEPFNISAFTGEGTNAFQAAVTHGIDLLSECGARGRCGKCQILANPDCHLTPLTDTERQILPPAKQSAGYRLACVAKILGAYFFLNECSIVR